MSIQIPAAPEVPILGEVDFDSKMKTFQKWEHDELQPKANELAKEVENNKSLTETYKGQAETYKDQAAESANQSAVSANYIGEWKPGGSYASGQSVSYEGYFYRVKEDIDDSQSPPPDDTDHFAPSEGNLSYTNITLSDIAVMLRALSLPFEYGIAFRGKANFNSTVGVTIPLPLSFPSSDFYTIGIAPLENSGFIGEIYVEKGNNSFTVFNTGSDAETQFEYTVLIVEYLNKTREA